MSAHAFEGEQYILAPDARPRAIRRDPDGSLWAEFPIVPVRDARSMDQRAPIRHVPSPRPVPHEEQAPVVPDDVPGCSMKPDPLEAKTVPEFILLMNKYRRWAGKPSFREMAARVGTCSAAGFCEALKADKLPTFPLLNAFVVSLSGSYEDFQRWATAWRALDGQAPGMPLMLLLPPVENEG